MNGEASSRQVRIDKLVLRAFVGPEPGNAPRNKDSVRHFDGNPANCSVSNLAWIDFGEEADQEVGDIADERWLAVPGCPDYEASDLGRVRCWRDKGGGRRDRPLPVSSTVIEGLPKINLSAVPDGLNRPIRLDKIVLETFVGPCPGKAPFGHNGKVRHIDGDRFNCQLENLEWIEPATKASGENWRAVPGRPGYEVSDRGRVGRNLADGGFNILKPWTIERYGYLYVTFAEGYGLPREKPFVHTLVLEVFVGPCPPDMQCRHLNGKRADCRLDNLCWGTIDEQVADKIRHGTLIPATPIVDPEPFWFTDRFVPVEAIVPWEVWKPVEDWSGYEVSNFGRVRSYRAGYGVTRKRPIIRRLQYDKDGRASLGLQVSYGGRVKKRRFLVQRLVIEAFSPQMLPDVECRHVDGKAGNNHIHNLRWGTSAENNRDKILHGTSLRGERHPSAILTTLQVREIKARLKAGERPSRLAREFHVHPETIGSIRRGENWRHVECPDLPVQGSCEKSTES